MDVPFKVVVDVNMWLNLFEELRAVHPAHHHEALMSTGRKRTENLRVMSEVARGEWEQVVATQHVWNLLQTKLRAKHYGATEKEVQYFLGLFQQMMLATGGGIAQGSSTVDWDKVNGFMRAVALPDVEDTMLVLSAFEVGATTILTHDNHLASCAWNLDDFNAKSDNPTKPEILWRDHATREQKIRRGDNLMPVYIRFHQNKFSQVVVDHRDRGRYLALPLDARKRQLAAWRSRPENIL